MISTRPSPPWLLDGFSTYTYLEKTVIVRYGFTNNPPLGVTNVDAARQATYTVPSTTWKREP